MFGFAIAVAGKRWFEDKKRRFWLCLVPQSRVPRAGTRIIWIISRIPRVQLSLSTCVGVSCRLRSRLLWLSVMALPFAISVGWSSSSSSVTPEKSTFSINYWEKKASVEKSGCIPSYFPLPFLKIEQKIEFWGANLHNPPWQ